jgi:hypothetical protein
MGGKRVFEDYRGHSESAWTGSRHSQDELVVREDVGESAAKRL